jgi:predicted AlkP superfamily pyrophosphatase or phosphodiesterase
MNKKIILFSIDGMRSDALKACGNPFVKELEKKCAYTYSAKSMNPSITLPCHFSMTHSVTPQRHGILTNTYIPQVRPVKGLFELIAENRGVNAFFYGWEPLRDIALPGALKFATYVNAYMQESGDTVLTNECIKLVREHKPDFVFLYQVETDEKGGHDNGFMSKPYLERISIAIDNVKRVMDEFSDEYSFILMADHGGHDRVHGTDMPEDMIIPIFFYGDDFIPGEINKSLSLLDIAPTIVKVLGILPDDQWEGSPVF